jgi:molybdopterin synthase sulfur carrier subunit
MSIKVRYFASLKEHVGRGEDELILSNAMTVQAIWQQLNPQINLPESALAALNMDYVTMDTLVGEGDEVAFFPPVTGG